MIPASSKRKEGSSPDAQHRKPFRSNTYPPVVGVDIGLKGMQLVGYKNSIIPLYAREYNERLDLRLLDAGGRA